MFDDPKKELKRLEEQLLAEEDWLDGELEEAHRLLGDIDEPDDLDMDHTRVYRNHANGYGNQIRNYANGYGTRTPRSQNTDDIDLDLDEYSDELDEPQQEKSVRGLVILAVLETLGIVGVILYWLIMLL